MGKYVCGVEVNVGKYNKDLGKALDRVNKDMKGFGFDEKLSVRAHLFDMSIEMPKASENKEPLVRIAAEMSVAEAFNDVDGKMISFKWED